MAQDVQAWKKKRRRLWLGLVVLGVLLAVAVMPPMVSIGRYKSRITHLMSESLGRPVRLASVELRLLPRPGFVLTDLIVEEDPAYGAEPVLHANTVTAAIRLMSLWRGRLEISTVSVDEASLNIVRTPEGRWNLDSLFRTAAAKVQPAGIAQAGRKHGALPYLEATNSRINFKQGAEKLPFSLVQTDLSFWQEEPGDWRLRLRGQPARTDLSLDLADTGVVRLEARALAGPELRKLPVHLDLEWREAQLGQLARLLIGSDPGWRGDLTGEMHLDGTPEAAEVKTRLRAIGVHRAEFAPAAPLDFDASCSFLYHYSDRATEHLLCESPLGDGRVRVTGELPGNQAAPHLAVELDRIPVAAGLDALRTVRSDFGPGLQAGGTISGKVSYAEPAAAIPAAETHGAPRRGRINKTRTAPAGPLTGEFTVEGLQLSGEGWQTPIQAAKLVLEPAGLSASPPADHGAAQRPATESAPVGFQTTVSVPLGGATPLTVAASLATNGYRWTAHGSVGMARARELAHLAGLKDSPAVEALSGDAVTLDVAGSGPWLVGQDASGTGAVAAATLITPAEPMASTPIDALSGTVTLHNASWKADYLVNRLEIAQATLHFGDGEMRWDPMTLSYGPVKAKASLALPAHCDQGQVCMPRFEVHFEELNGSVLQAAILGAQEQGTLLSTLIDRFKLSNPTAALGWPPMEGVVKADSLILGPVTLSNASATVRMTDGVAEIDGLDAELLGGHVQGTGTLHVAGAAQAKPSYTVECRFEKVDPAALGALLGQSWTGRSLDGAGKAELNGFTAGELASSAKGTLHFDWRRGTVEAPEDDAAAVASPLARFDRWTADAEIADGVIKLTANELLSGAQKDSIEGSVTLANPPRVNLAAGKVTQAKR